MTDLLPPTTEMEVTGKVLAKTLADVQVIDVREPWEFEQGSLKGAVNIPLGQIVDRREEIQKLGQEKRIVIVCHHGRRSMNACILIRGQGLEDALSLQGGIHEWSLNQDPSIPLY